MKVLVSNVGSSSYKFSLLDMTTEDVIAKGRVERIGDAVSPYEYAVTEGKAGRGSVAAPAHIDAVAHVMDFLVGEMHGAPVLGSLKELDAVGFKTVFAKGHVSSAIIDEDVIAGLEAYIPILPAHNPAYLASIRAFERVAPSVPRVAVFETWFHETMPAYAAELGVPKSWSRAPADMAFTARHTATSRAVLRSFCASSTCRRRPRTNCAWFPATLAGVPRSAPFTAAGRWTLAWRSARRAECCKALVAATWIPSSRCT